MSVQSVDGAGTKEEDDHGYDVVDKKMGCSVHNNDCSTKKDGFAVAHNEDDIVDHCLCLV